MTWELPTHSLTWHLSFELRAFLFYFVFLVCTGFAWAVCAVCTGHVYCSTDVLFVLVLSILANSSTKTHTQRENLGDQIRFRSSIFTYEIMINSHLNSQKTDNAYANRRNTGIYPGINHATLFLNNTKMAPPKDRKSSQPRIWAKKCTEGNQFPWQPQTPEAIETTPQFAL